MSYSHILFEAADDGIATIVLNRPDKLNALDSRMIGELDAVIAGISGDPKVRAFIVTGAGEKAFAAGADIKELSQLSPEGARTHSARGQAVLRKLETCGKISVAAVNGYALGGGLEVAMSCTLRFASSNARFGLPEVKLGLIPGYGGTQRLARLVGPGRALEMLLSGEPVDAGEAFRIGLVNRVVPQPELMDFCREWLRNAVSNGPLALSAVMEAVDVGADSGLETGLRFEAAAFGMLAATEDRAEGLKAFLEKRKASFTGR